MDVLLAGLSSAVVVFIAHVALWRMRPGKFQTSFLILFFLMGSTVAAFLGYLLSMSWIALAHTILLYLVLGAGYVLVYQGIEEESPTLKIIRNVAAARERGVLPRDLLGLFSEETLVLKRIDYLVETKMITRNGVILKLMPAGESLLKRVRFIRRFLGLNHSEIG